MDIHYAILGLLNWKPFTGYDLKKIISDSDLFYWSGNNNQIYYSLVHLHQMGFVTQSVEQQENLPAKKIYQITPRGQLQLRDWSLQQPELPEIKLPFLIQLAWTGLLSDEEVDQLLDQYQTELEIQVRMQEEQLTRGKVVPARTRRETLIWESIDTHLNSRLQQELDWVRQLRVDLSQGSTPA